MRRKVLDHVQIETVNRCNLSCKYCVYRHYSSFAKRTVMTNSQLTKILQQLKKSFIVKRISLFVTNEPLLDRGLATKLAITRKYFKDSFIDLYTNGTLLTIEKLEKIADTLDRITISLQGVTTKEYDAATYTDYHLRPLLTRIRDVRKYVQIGRAHV